jgi:lipopolysaccharide export LptBFGC system permease protein LptF
MSYLDRDLLRSFTIIFFSLLLFVQVGIFVSFLMNMYADVFGASQNKFAWFLLFYTFSLPRQLANTIPMCVAVSVLLMYTIKARQNELLAYLVGGVSPLRLARPMLLVGLIGSVLAFGLIEVLANAGDREAERIKRTIIEERSEESLTREQKVFQKGRGDRFYMIRSFKPSQNRMDFPYLFDLHPEWKSLHWTLDAESAELPESSDQWVFRNVNFRQYDEAGNVVAFRQAAVAKETEILPAEVRLENELARYIRQRWRPSQMSAMELLDYIELFKLQNKPTYELKTHLHFNIATAMGCLVLTCLMVGHILRPSSAGVLVGFGGGLGFVALYYVVFLFARDASMVGSIPAALASYGTNTIFLLVAAVLLRRNRTA